MRTLLFLLISCALYGAHPPVKEDASPFDPWYTGPLVATSANNMPPHQYNVQPYLTLIDVYGSYQDNFSLNTGDNLFKINPIMYMQMGLTKYFDAEITLQSFFNVSNGRWTSYLGDTTFTLGTQLYVSKKESFIPTLRLTLAETFPTGNYKNFDPRKTQTEQTGHGSFQTQILLSANSLYFWRSEHPLSLTANLGFTVPSKVKVSGFNSYGGGYNTRGKVFPGYSLIAILSPELSLSQRWVLATDIIYQHSFQGSFSGIQGTTSTGSAAKISTSSSDVLWITPAIEYNFSSNFGIVSGVIVSLFGRNTNAFFSGAFSVTYVF